MAFQNFYFYKIYCDPNRKEQFLHLKKIPKLISQVQGSGRWSCISDRRALPLYNQLKALFQRYPFLYSWAIHKNLLKRGKTAKWGLGRQY